MLNGLKWRLRALLRKSHMEQELDEELRYHLERQTEQNIRLGMSLEEARRAALWSFGGVEQAKEQSRDARGTRWLEELWQDLRYGSRMLAKQAGFTSVAALTLALGIGANTAIFSVVNAVLLRPLPYPAAERLFVLTEKLRSGQRIGVSYPDYQDWRGQARSFTEMAGFRGAFFNLTGVERPVRLQGRAVNWNFFRMLGVQPQLGRLFVADDDQTGAARTTLLGHALWQAKFGGDPTIIGKTLSLNGDSYTVIGVLPAGFEFFRQDDLFIPLGVSVSRADQERGNHGGLNLLARLKEGSSLSQASAEMDTLTARLERAYPNTNTGTGALTYRLLDRYASDIKQTLWVLLCAVGFVLVIACVNVANLLLVRAVERQKEIAVRLALGAGRWRIVRQLLSESLLMALISGAAGALLGAWMMEGLLKLAPDGVPRLNQTKLDPTVLLFTLGISVLTGLLFSLLPAWRSAGHDLHATLKEGGRRSAGAGREKVRKTLLVAEIALSLVLLVGAGLMLRTVYQLTHVDPGFATENLLTMQFNLPGNVYDEPHLQGFYNESLRRIEALPGVRAAALTVSLPIDGSNWNSIVIAADKAVPPRAQLPASAITPVSANYFQAMGIRLLKGRVFTEADTANKPTVIVINEALATRLWPGEDPLGKRLKQGWPEDKTPWREVVGVVADVKLNGVDQDTPPQTYLPLGQTSSNSLCLAVRTSGDPLNLAATVEQTLHTIDKDLPVFDVHSMDQLLGSGIAQQRLVLVLLLGFALLALLLAAVGVYGVISYSVSQRTHEIGIRMALGAQKRDVLRLVIGQGAKLTLVGVGIGVLSSLALTRLMKSLLFGVSASDPVTFASISLLLMCVALLATWLPARRATKLDPMVALHYE